MIYVIGYGNELRGDDAVGPRVAHAVAVMKLAGVRADAVHQLTPELAEPLAKAASAIFVDAAVDGVPGQVEVVPCGPVDLKMPLGHLSDPHALLALAEAVFGQSPSAWLVRIHVAKCDLGETLSPAALGGIRRGIEAIRTLVIQLQAGDDHAHSADHDHERDHPGESPEHP